MVIYELFLVVFVIFNNIHLLDSQGSYSHITPYIQSYILTYSHTYSHTYSQHTVIHAVILLHTYFIQSYYSPIGGG